MELLLSLFTVLVSVGAVLAMGWVGVGIGVSLWRALRDREPVRRTGPAGEFIHIPVLDVKRFRPRGYSSRGELVFYGLGLNMHTRFRVYETGVECRWLRGPVMIPFHAIERVDVLPTRSAFALSVRGEAKAIGVMPTSHLATRHALWLLAHHCPMSDRAREVIADPPPAP